MLKIGVHGATGKAGKHVVTMIKQDSILTLSGCYSQITQTSLDIFCQNADVIIDFSLAPAVEPLVKAAAANNTSLVIATTGLSDATQQLIKQTSTIIPILYSANMSYGANVLNRILRLASQLLSPIDYDVNIMDKHHKFKKDSPSGTALMLSKIINTEWSTVNIMNNNFGQISHSSIKLGSIVGEHQVTFANLDEQIVISHIAENKDVFAKGAIKAAKWLHNKPAGLYSMADLV